MAATYYDVKSRRMDDHPADDRSAWERRGDPKLSTIEGKGRTFGTYLVIELRQAFAAGDD